EKYLPEITALIDPRQFELITRPDTGIVIIQGGAGSGKTTIGLHRMAYLAFQNPEKYRPERMLVLVYNDALVRYISRVLPSLGVHGVPVLTFERWAEKLRKSHLPATPSLYADDTPSSVTRLKKHPKMLDAIEEYCEEVSAQIESCLSANLSGIKGAEEAMAFWRANPKAPPALRLHRLLRWASEGEAARIPMLRHGIERTIAYARRELLDVVVAWANILTDRQRLERFFAQDPDIDSHDLSIALRHASERCGQVLNEVERIEEEEESDDRRKARKSKSPDSELSWGDTEEEIFDDDPSVGVDGVQEEEPARLDREDDALFLRIIQRLRGPLLHSPGKQSEVLRYEHIFVDEVQDLSPVELAVVLGTATKQRSVTMAGDAAQRLHMDNGFKNWAELLRAIDPRRIGEESAPIEIEPLRVQYRSTHQIIALAQAVLGPLADPNAGHAIREGVPVELFVFSHSGEAVAHLAQALRELMQLEPRASVCLIARYPEQADIYYRGLLSAEVPHLRRIADQDFPFRAGIDVTDVRQVKGLEFDYVVLLECSSASYPVNDESRHLLHIAITRAAHQLWITTTGEPSLLLPESLRQGAH
ncbi:MAG: ATP-binding domain-containing protein, partial [Deltaproteobacteria bacterium]|nr:ATP-binding domain-containing protein [Deltaproteobacteria bacterium]